MVRFTREWQDGKLVNLTGRELWAIEGEQIDLSHLSSRIYVVIEGEISLQITKKQGSAILIPL